MSNSDALTADAFMHIIEEALRAGVSCVQIREKHSSTREFIKKAQFVKRVVQNYNVPLLINDRVDVALAAGVDGVHIGEDDMPYADARKLLGAHAIIGLTVNLNRTLLQEAEKSGMVDYYAIGAIYPTNTKEIDVVGLEGLSSMRPFTQKPLVAIGGIDTTKVKEVMAHGADSIAVVSAICNSTDPYQSASDLLRAMNTQ